MPCFQPASHLELRYGGAKRGNPADLWAKIEQQILPRIQILSFSYKEALSGGTHPLSILIGQPIGTEDIMIARLPYVMG